MPQNTKECNGQKLHRRVVGEYRVERTTSQEGILEVLHKDAQKFGKTNATSKLIEYSGE